MVSLVFFVIMFMSRFRASRLSLGALRRSYSRSNLVMQPEGPEVASLADSLNQRLGTTKSWYNPIITPEASPVNNLSTIVRLKNVDIISGRYTKKKPEGWEILQEHLQKTSAGLHLSDIKTKGKFIYFTFVSHPDLSLWSTLGLAGGWTFQSHRHTRLKLTFEIERMDNNGITEIISLYFFDTRNFGTFKVSNQRTELEEKLRKLGIDWLSKDPENRVTLSQFVGLGKAAARRGRSLAVFLMDQSKTAGIGNYLLSEVLYVSKIHPFALCASLDNESWEGLYIAIRDTIQCSYFSQTQLDGVFHESEKLLSGRDNFTDYSKFEFIIYAQQYTRDTKDKVVRQEGAHKRTIHWVPSIQTKHTPESFHIIQR